MSKGKQTVVIVYRSLPQYRLHFYEGLRLYLAERGVRLRLIHGQPMGSDATKLDSVVLPWAESIHNVSIKLGTSELIWQPVLLKIRGSDLVIVEQASKLLVNYVLVLLGVLGLSRVAFWGHGRNFQSDRPSSLAERVKRLLSRHVAWWFAYNETSATIVRDLGYPPERITSVQNSVDTSELRAARNAMTEESMLSVRRSIGIEQDSRLCVYVGGMYPEKRLEFLVSACDRIREALDSFEMVFVGTGPSVDQVVRACAHRPWMHHVGPKFGDEKASIVSTAELMLMPGLVGLAVVDSFALRVPLVTTDVPYHSPEIEYLVDGENGLVVSDAQSAQAYADCVVATLTDAQTLNRLVSGCERSAKQYTMEAMVRNFGEGVLEALVLNRAQTG